jgi:hypothetical protein
MKLLKVIGNFIQKAKLEAAKEYSVDPAAGGSSGSLGKVKNGAERKGWIGVDLDGTLAYADSLSGTSQIGDPIPKMVDLVREMTGEGYRIKIFTARASDAGQVYSIREWLRKNGLPDLEITNIKDFDMIRLYDDRAVQVIANTGELVTPPTS